MDTAAPRLNREHIRPGDRLCAAVSGGADSVALLLLLHAANRLPRNALGVGLAAAHVHHGLRGEEADADLAFVEALCARLEVPLHIHRASVAARVAETKETVEEAARGLRYGFFASLLAQGHADSVLTAHTLDDQTETVLMKLLRGAWTEGLSGIHPAVPFDDIPGAGPKLVGQSARLSGRILRPLLGVRRAELRAFLEASRQPWREDASNADTAFTRNRIRHQLLPILREYNPAIDHALANLAELAREDEARWQSELARILPQLLLPGKPVRGGGRAVGGGPRETTVSIELERLGALDPSVRRRVLRAAARQLGGRLSFDETARLLAFCRLQPTGFQAGNADAARTGSSLQLSAGLLAQRSPRELRLSRANELKASKLEAPMSGP